MTIEDVANRWRTDAKNGDWKPAAGDSLDQCEFLRAGFRSWSLEAAPADTNRWKLTLSRLDFGARDPSALLEVHAEGHEMAFGDLGWFVFGHSIGTNGGTNFNQAVKRLHATLGGSEEDWARRLTYLIRRAKEANVSGGNGTYRSAGVPELSTLAEWAFDRRIRMGRTMSLFGPGSAGKTTLLDGLIVSACSGIEVLPGWKPTRQFSFLVLDWDEGYEEEVVRLSAICRAYDVALAGGYHYKRMTRPLHDVADEIGSYISAEGIDIVAVSPMGRAQRNMGENLTAPVDEVYEVLRTFGTTNVLVDHVTGEKMQGGAEREFGSVRKRDNARGSYSVYAQSEEIGRRVLVMRNTKPDALAPRQPDQAIRVEYRPEWPNDDGSYDEIDFNEDQIKVIGYAKPGDPMGGIPTMRVTIHDALLDDDLTVEELGFLTMFNLPSIRTVLNRNKDWFEQRAGGKWHAKPIGT